MLEISAADILKIGLTVITMFIAVVKTPFRIRRENHDKLLKLLESVEKPHSEPVCLLLFRDYIGSKTVGLAELRQLLALPDGVTALERYRFTGGRQQILRTTSAGFVLQRRADSALKRSLLSCRYLLKYLLFVTLLVLMPMLAQWGLRQLGVLVIPPSLVFMSGGYITDGWQLLFPGLLFIIIMLSLTYLIFRQLALAGNLSSERAFYRYYQQAREEQRCREVLSQLRDALRRT
ncbi:hypothetical protein [Serratia surfactantfaciens]|uniref:hypothetical protein n=1 Tax=Serratia surfactantfaciens TaxID=2741499 RepID=UPI001B3C932D|nr:hypothetical protein [Serratia surfactantfaciens]